MKQGPPIFGGPMVMSGLSFRNVFSPMPRTFIRSSIFLKAPFFSRYSMMRAATIAQTYQCVRKGGSAVVIGVPKMTEILQLPAALIWMEEKSLMGSTYGSGQPKQDIPMLIKLYQRGRLKLDELVTATYKIEDAPRAFEDLEKGVNARGVIVL